MVLGRRCLSQGINECDSGHAPGGTWVGVANDTGQPYTIHATRTPTSHPLQPPVCLSTACALLAWLRILVAIRMVRVANDIGQPCAINVIERHRPALHNQCEPNTHLPPLATTCDRRGQPSIDDESVTPISHPLQPPVLDRQRCLDS